MVAAATDATSLQQALAGNTLVQSAPGGHSYRYLNPNGTGWERIDTTPASGTERHETHRLTAWQVRASAEGAGQVCTASDYGAWTKRACFLPALNGGRLATQIKGFDYNLEIHQGMDPELKRLLDANPQSLPLLSREALLFDGEYRGPATLVLGDAKACVGAGTDLMMVNAGVAKIGIYSNPIAPDGTVVAMDSRGDHLMGRLVGLGFEGTATSADGSCSFKITLTRTAPEW